MGWTDHDQSSEGQEEPDGTGRAERPYGIERCRQQVVSGRAIHLDRSTRPSRDDLLIIDQEMGIGPALDAGRDRVWRHCPEGGGRGNERLGELGVFCCCTLLYMVMCVHNMGVDGWMDGHCNRCEGPTATPDSSAALKDPRNQRG